MRAASLLIVMFVTTNDEMSSNRQTHQLIITDLPKVMKSHALKLEQQCDVE